jgi:hypothetical protein
MTPRAPWQEINQSKGAVRPELLGQWGCLVCDASGEALDPASAFRSHWAYVHGDAQQEAPDA